ncbi:YcgN family cysteine cluster protein [Candidatus Vondammii sp. HM_W22]|uniref:YcgN family cysteine cluster protein n=1 Tax=Candidatus Vondammii sp. HM_W22 TaxID=2687299 RepID=UPI001F1400CF|nr:YcgN family cysteine cluster protein [Candidatus Vondammii sp. HM_W22]
MTKLEPEFWENRPLSALSKEEWEALCDGCAKCCLHRLEDIDTREIRFTNVCCRYLDQDSCHCTDYPNRSVNVPECVTVTLEVLDDPYWLPESCAYRLLAEGKPLYWWHPLVSGTRDSLTKSANRIGGRVVSELDADDLEYHMIDWIR